MSIKGRRIKYKIEIDTVCLADSEIPSRELYVPMLASIDLLSSEESDWSGEEWCTYVCSLAESSVLSLWEVIAQAESDE